MYANVANGKVSTRARGATWGEEGSAIHFVVPGSPVKKEKKEGDKGRVDMTGVTLTVTVFPCLFLQRIVLGQYNLKSSTDITKD